MIAIFQWRKSLNVAKMRLPVASMYSLEHGINNQSLWAICRIKELEGRWEIIWSIFVIPKHQKCKAICTVKSLKNDSMTWSLIQKIIFYYLWFFYNPYQKVLPILNLPWCNVRPFFGCVLAKINTSPNIYFPNKYISPLYSITSTPSISKLFNHLHTFSLFVFSFH